MVRIRLRRTGLKKQATYRVVIADKESPRDGRYIEIIGTYNPRTQPALINIDEARLMYWLKSGAQPSESVAKLMKTSGAEARWERFKKGESLDALVAEAEESKAKNGPQTLKTRQATPANAS